MLPPETNVNGVKLFRDEDTFIDSNKVCNIVNKLETTGNDKNKRKIMICHVNIPIFPLHCYVTTIQN